MLADGLKPPALVVAGHQAAGRGQRGRGWFSSPASLAVSFLLPCGDRPVQRLPLLVGLVAREMIGGLVRGSAALVQVKWPNDVLIDGRKVAGILCERRDGADIIGIGINIHHEPGEIPAELEGSLIALSDIGAAIERWEVLASLAEGMRRRLLENSHEVAWTWVMREWPEHDALAGREVEVSTSGGMLVGTANGIDSNGLLRLIKPGGETVCVATGTVRAKPAA